VAVRSRSARAILCRSWTTNSSALTRTSRKHGGPYPAFDKDEAALRPANASVLHYGAAGRGRHVGGARPGARFPVLALIPGVRVGRVDPKVMGMGPVRPRASAAAGRLETGELDLMEINEHLRLRPARNKERAGIPADQVNGRRDRAGPPDRASGLPHLVTLLHEMKRRDASAAWLRCQIVEGGSALRSSAASRSGGGAHRPTNRTEKRLTGDREYDKVAYVTVGGAASGTPLAASSMMSATK